jgi:hypothetical protein
LWGRRQREAELFGSLRGSTSPQAHRPSRAAGPPTPANGTTDSEGVVRERAGEYVPLATGARHGTKRSTRWRLEINATIEAEA